MTTRAQTARAEMQKAGINSADDINDTFLGAYIDRNRAIIQAVIFDGIPARTVASEYGLSEARVWQLPLAITRKVATGIKSKGNETRVMNALKNEGLNLEDAPFKLSREKMLRLPNIGRQSVDLLNGELERRGLPGLCNTERQLEDRLKSSKVAKQHNGLPQCFAASVRMALKMYPPEGRETVPKWLARLEKMS
jgi:hypothetical protein